MIFDEIESQETSWKANLASGTSVFVRILTNQDCFPKLREDTKDAANFSLMIGRFIHLLKNLGDPSYESPHDVAIAAYLMIAKERDPLVAEVLAKKINPRENHLFWARHIAAQIISQQ